MEIGSLLGNVLSLRKSEKERCLEIPNSPDFAQDPDARLVEDCKGRDVAA